MINKKNRYGFSFIELVFVIVIMGIIGKFGVEFLAQAYKSFIFSNVNNELQTNSAYAVELISKKLEHRIKQSVVYRNLTIGGTATNSRSLDSGSDANATVLEWIGTDIEGYRGDNNTTDYWSGVIDLNLLGSNTNIASLRTNTAKVNNLIQILSTTSTINDAALYFVGSFPVGSSVVGTEWGWDGNVATFNAQANVNIHPIRNDANTSIFVPRTGAGGADNNLSGVEATEYYKLAWTAYAVAFTNIDPVTNMGDLILYYNYQPWKGEQYDDAGIGVKQVLLMQDVSSFQYRVAGSLMKIQVCTKSVLLSNEEYSLCKEKTVY